ncbi:MAG: DNA binding protein [Geoglossum simile]|nr:MAG: DNA binding protein [Geoglossum simile]
MASSTRCMSKNDPSSPQTTAVGVSRKTSALLDQTLQQHQSVELIQAAVGIAIGCLAYLRDLVPEDAFSRATYGHPSSNIYSYKDLGHSSAARGNAIGAQNSLYNAKGNPEAKGAGVRVSILKRGHSEEVNQLLDWIELGIFEALQKGVLAAARFAIFVDKSKPEDIAESYTFTFRYQGEMECGTRFLSGMDMASPPGLVITLRGARDGLQKFIRHLCTVTSLFPRLPTKRYLSVQLYYTDDCPPEYEPPGFKKCETSPMYFSETEDLKVAKGSIDMDTGIHEISLKVSTIDTVSRRKGDALISRVMADDDIELATSHSLVRGNSLQNEVIGTPCPSDGAEESDVMTDIRRADQARADNVRMKELGEFEMVSTQPQSSNVETQKLPSTQVALQRLGSLSLRAPSPIRQSADQRKTLSRRKLEELTAMSASLRPGMSLGETGDPTMVRCVCGTKGKDASMFLCEFCRQLQHTHCYGFRDNDDPRISDPRACYNCLLGDTEIQILEQLKVDCVFRRALKLVYGSGYPISEKEFSLLLGCDDTDISQITSRLKREGFIVLNHQKRSSQKREPKFRVVKSPAKLNQRDLRYFDPMAMVARYYDDPKSIGSLTQSMVGSINLPPESSPPATLSEMRGSTEPAAYSGLPPNTVGEVEASRSSLAYSARGDSKSEDLAPLAPVNLAPLTSPRRSRRLMNQNRKAMNSYNNLEGGKATTLKRKSTKCNSGSVKRFRISENNKLLELSVPESPPAE